MKWYNSYTGFPYKHLGDDIITGIDCFNLCRLVYKEKLNIEIDYDTFFKKQVLDQLEEFDKIDEVKALVKNYEKQEVLS